MLQLLHNGGFVQFVRAGTNFKYDGHTVSGASLGWKSPDGTWELVAYVPPELEPYVPTPEELRAAMPSLTARQLRLALIGGGFQLSQVEAAIAAISDEQERAVAQVEWEYASQFERMHPLIAQVGSVLGLTPEQIDAMWTTALEL